ncbi:hypothetical protein AABC73_12920 [Pseudomonas sp. G.S.17]|uniref:hypothetical protein n=1 Tax=Pseudomonas sp. G.S.17 TaxID=3137451 RepID=UPI00311C9C71
MTVSFRPQAEIEVDVFCWLIASFLFGKRIQQQIFDVGLPRYRWDSQNRLGSENGGVQSPRVSLAKAPTRAQQPGPLSAGSRLLTAVDILTL